MDNAPSIKHETLADALAAAQTEMPAIAKERVGKVQGETTDGRRYEYNYQYADLADVLAGGRRMHLDDIGGRWLDPLATDEQLVVFGLIGGLRHGSHSTDFRR